jgi:uncharacterized membrane protein
MESKAKIFGHPIHPILIVFPLGLLATSVIFDILYLLTNDAQLTVVAFYMIGAGIVGGAIAAIFGIIDWAAIPGRTRAKDVANLHGIGNVVVMILFAVSWLMRRDLPDAPPTTALVLSFLGVLIAAFTGWMGGELVDRLAVGVDPGAHLNSPNSLSGRPASESETSHQGLQHDRTHTS